jgi:hypothetical protein
MARLKKAKIKRSKAGKAFKQWDQDYLSSRKAKRTYKTSSRPVKKFKR